LPNLLRSVAVVDTEVVDTEVVDTAVDIEDIVAMDLATVDLVPGTDPALDPSGFQFQISSHYQL